MAELATVAGKEDPLAIMAVPAEAPRCAAKLVAVGIRGILNFAAVSLIVPESVSVQGVDLAV